MVFARIVIAVCAMGAIAHAETGTSLFEEGRELAKQAKYAEACDKFAKSYELERAAGTALNFADCQEHLGNLARAWQLFDQAAASAEKERNAVRAQYARQRANNLLPRLGTLVLAIERVDTQLRVTVGGRDVVPGNSVRTYVDPGEVEVIAEVPGKRFSKLVTIRAGATSELAIPALVGASSGSSSGGGRKRGWVIAAGVSSVVGLGAMTGSALLTLAASRQYSDAFAEGHCFHTSRGAECTADGLAIVDNARDRANLATGLFIGGAVLVGAGVVLYVVAPKQRYEVTPSASDGGAGVTISGVF